MSTKINIIKYLHLPFTYATDAAIDDSSWLPQEDQKVEKVSSKGTKSKANRGKNKSGKKQQAPTQKQSMNIFNLYVSYKILLISNQLFPDHSDSEEEVTEVI